MQIDDDEQRFLERRAAEERRKTTETSCLVRSVHEEMVELYEERSMVAKADTAALAALLDRLP